MVEKAIKKLEAEMSQNKNNPYMQVVGGFLVQHIQQNPGAAEKILANDKTIGKSLDEMRKAAEKKKAGNCAVLTDAEGFEIVLKYFGIEGKASLGPLKVNNTPSVITKEPQAKSSVDFDVSLDEFLK